MSGLPRMQAQFFCGSSTWPSSTYGVMEFQFFSLELVPGNLLREKQHPLLATSESRCLVGIGSARPCIRIPAGNDYFGGPM